MKEFVLVKEVPYGTALVKTGMHSFSSKLVEGGLISRHDVAVAEQHALREQLHLVDAVVALGFVRESDSYSRRTAGKQSMRLSGNVSI
jgi:predicted GNAT family N-acyltransferase